MTDSQRMRMDDLIRANPGFDILVAARDEIDLLRAIVARLQLELSRRPKTQAATWKPIAPVEYPGGRGHE